MGAPALPSCAACSSSFSLRSTWVYESTVKRSTSLFTGFKRTVTTIPRMVMTAMIKIHQMKTRMKKKRRAMRRTRRRILRARNRRGPPRSTLISLRRGPLWILSGLWSRRGGKSSRILVDPSWKVSLTKKTRSRNNQNKLSKIQRSKEMSPAKWR